MATQRQRNGNLLATRPKQRPAVDKFPARRFPIQHEIQNLENELDAFNERIAELENEGHWIRGANPGLYCSTRVGCTGSGFALCGTPTNTTRRRSSRPCGRPLGR
jgi:hypothetical protein